MIANAVATWLRDAELTIGSPSVDVIGRVSELEREGTEVVIGYIIKYII